MAKIMTTQCLEHENCTVRVTLDDGAELIEHIRTLTTVESDLFATRLLALEEAQGRVTAAEARIDGLEVGIRSVVADVVDVNQVLSTLAVTDPRFDGLSEAVSELRDVVARLEAQFRQTVSITDESTARSAELVADLADLTTAATGEADLAHSRIDDLETKVADLRSEVVAHLKAADVNP